MSDATPKNRRTTTRRTTGTDRRHAINASDEHGQPTDAPEATGGPGGPGGPGGRGDPGIPDGTRERARLERRDLDLERGEPVSNAAERYRPRSLTRNARPLSEWPTRPKILITNDDGIESRGMLALKEALDPIGDTFVVAPDSNQSAVGHLKTLMRPLRVRERALADGSLGWSVDGSPTDCVSLAFLGFFEHGFDLVASGINYGANLGDDITYSGTVSAAMEGVINGCPSFSVSQEYYAHPDFTLAAMAAAMVARNILEHGLSPMELLNVNVPAVSPDDCEGVEITRQGKRVYQDELIRRVDPRGIPYYWIGGPAPSGVHTPGTDFHAVVNRRIAVTPIHLDLTGRTLLKRLRGWDWQLEPSLPAASEQVLQAPTRRDRPLEASREEELTEEATRERR